MRRSSEMYRLGAGYDFATTHRANMIGIYLHPNAKSPLEIHAQVRSGAAYGFGKSDRRPAVKATERLLCAFVNGHLGDDVICAYECEHDAEMIDHAVHAAFVDLLQRKRSEPYRRLRNHDDGSADVKETLRV